MLVVWRETVHLIINSVQNETTIIRTYQCTILKSEANSHIRHTNIHLVLHLHRPTENVYTKTILQIIAANRVTCISRKKPGNSNIRTHLDAILWATYSKYQRPLQ